MVGQALLCSLFLDVTRDLLLETGIDVNNVPTLRHGANLASNAKSSRTPRPITWSTMKKKMQVTVTMTSTAPDVIRVLRRVGHVTRFASARTSRT